MKSETLAVRHRRWRLSVSRTGATKEPRLGRPGPARGVRDTPPPAGTCRHCETTSAVPYRRWRPPIRRAGATKKRRLGETWAGALCPGCHRRQCLREQRRIISCPPPAVAPTDPQSRCHAGVTVGGDGNVPLDRAEPSDAKPMVRRRGTAAWAGRESTLEQAERLVTETGSADGWADDTVRGLAAQLGHDPLLEWRLQRGAI